MMMMEGCRLHTLFPLLHVQHTGCDPADDVLFATQSSPGVDRHLADCSCGKYGRQSVLAISQQA